jgi:hypothetical protein
MYTSPERSWTAPSLLFSEYRRPLLKDRSVRLTTYLHLVSKLRITPPPPYAFMVCTLVRCYMFYIMEASVRNMLLHVEIYS